MSGGRRSIGLRSSPVKIGGAVFLVLLALAVPASELLDRKVVWDVLVVVVTRTDFERRTVTGRERLRYGLSDDDRALLRRELSAFRRRVTAGTDGRLAVRLRIVAVPGPLRTLSGPGPFFMTPRDVSPLLGGRVEVGNADTVMVFAKVGDRTGPAIPVSHLGAAYGGDQGVDGACFAGITFRSGWIDGSGTVALHEWLHGLRWALTELHGFDPASFPDPDEGRGAPDCCPDAPRGDSPFADHLLKHHLTPAMIRRADARVASQEFNLHSRAAASRPAALLGGQNR
jgi:hypothetical protein